MLAAGPAGPHDGECQMNEPTQQPQPITVAADPAQPNATDPSSSRSHPAVKQLDLIIENVTNYATPVLREIAARAAELAAKAGDAAGPIAQKAAERTGEVGDVLASKSRAFASDLRADSASPAVAVDADEPSDDLAPAS